MKKIISTLIILLFVSTKSFSQPINSYVFTESVGNYTPLVGATSVIGPGGFNDDSSFGPFNLGFSFIYHGTAFTTIGIQDNCSVALGTSAISSYGTILSTQANAIAVMNADMLGGAATNQISYLTTGSAGNHVFTVEWFNWGKYSSGLNEINIQLKLYEATQQVQIIYQPTTPISPFTCQVGLSGATVADFNDRTSTTSWLPTSAGLTNTVNMAFSNIIYPANGLTYTWSLPSPCSGTPTAGTTVSSVLSPICTGTNYTVYLNGSSVASGLTYQWQSSPNGSTWTTIGGGVSPSYSTSATTSGVIYYQCIVTCTGSGLSSVSTVLMITINQSPTVTITPNANQSFCVGGSVTLTANGGTTYLWSNSATTTSINATTTGSYTVTGTSGGCSTTSSAVFVNVMQLPVPIIYPPMPVLCNGGSMVLTASNASTYLWSTGATTPSITVTLPGTYSVTGTVSGCVSLPVSVVVTTGVCTSPGSLATSGITQHTAIIHWTNSICYSGYQIYVKKTQYTNWQYINVNAGTIIYQLTNLQNNYNVQWKIRTVCAPGSYSSWSNIQTIHTLPRLEDNEPDSSTTDELKITAYPNPTDGNATIQLNIFSDESNVVVTNMLGQIVYQQTYNTGETNGEIKLNMADLPQGIYIVFVMDEEGKRCCKIIKE